MKSFESYIERMLIMIEKIEKYTANIATYDEFRNNEEKIDACVTPLIQIGETASQIAKYFPQRADIPYKDIIGFRNILVHTYHKIDTKNVRNIIKHHIPKLKEIIIKHTSK